MHGIILDNDQHAKSQLPHLCCGDRSDALQVSEDGAILVRPDGHVAWRADMRQAVEECCAEDISKAAEQLRTALAALQYVHEN